MKKQKYWDISTLKKRAKTVLKENYWLSFGGSVFDAYVPSIVKSLIIRLACIGSFMAAVRQFTKLYNSGRLMRYAIPFFEDRFGFGFFDFDPRTLLDDPEITAVLMTFATAALSVSLVALVYKVFVQNLFEIGESRLYTSNRYGNRDFGNVFYGFKERYGHNMWAIFLRNLFLRLWTLLLIVPGIIKSFSYAMVPWIMAENPNLKAKRAITISRQMMKGEKWRKFWLDLSFLGWYILGALCLGIGVLFVIPYHKAAIAELYGALRVKAVKEGIVSPSELCAELFAQIPVNPAPQAGFEAAATEQTEEINEEEYSGLESDERVAEEVTEVVDKEQPGYENETSEAEEAEDPDISPELIVDPGTAAEEPEIKPELVFPGLTGTEETGEPAVSEQETGSAEAADEGGVSDATDIQF